MCAICNGRTYGGGFCAAPEAQPDDGWLDVYIIRKVSRVTIAKLLGMYKSGKMCIRDRYVGRAKAVQAEEKARRAGEGSAEVLAQLHNCLLYTSTGRLPHRKIPQRPEPPRQERPYRLRRPGPRLQAPAQGTGCGR